MMKEKELLKEIYKACLLKMLKEAEKDNFDPFTDEIIGLFRKFNYKVT